MKIFIFLIAFVFSVTFSAFAQDKVSGGVKGTVKLPTEKSISDVIVEAKQAGKTIATARTNGKGDFTMIGLKPGNYVFVFTKPGLSEGVSKEIEVKAGTMLTLKRLYLSVDEGTLAIVRGSVFDSEGRIARDVKIEILKISGDSAKKIGERLTDNGGDFAFRLPAEPARYRFVATAKDVEPISKDLEVNGAEIYRFAISLKPKKSQD